MAAAVASRLVTRFLVASRCCTDHLSEPSSSAEESHGGGGGIPPGYSVPGSLALPHFDHLSESDSSAEDAHGGGHDHFGHEANASSEGARHDPEGYSAPDRQRVAGVTRCRGGHNLGSLNDDDELSLSEDEDAPKAVRPTAPPRPATAGLTPDQIPSLPLALRPEVDKPDRGYETKKIKDQYLNEQVDASSFRAPDGNLDAWSKHLDNKDTKVAGVQTKYLNPMEQQQHELGAGGDGLLRTAAGELADSSASRDVGKMSQTEGKNIFVMTPEGKIRAADAWGNHTEKKGEDPADGTSIGFMNHSSLAAELGPWAADDRSYANKLHAGEVAAAGEMKLNQGKLEEVTDASGHYQPNNAMTGQLLDRVGEMGVDTHDTAVNVTRDRGQGKVLASAREFQGVRGDIASGKIQGYRGDTAPANYMADRRTQTKSGVEQAVAARDARLAGGVARMGGQDVAASDQVLDPRHGMGPAPDLFAEYAD